MPNRLSKPLALLAALAAGCAVPPLDAAGAEPPSQAPPGFWDTWGDGRAELAGYTLTMPRYGELRQGTVVLVTVTETFTRGQRVKSDGGHDDELPVVKLNDVRDFRTGIYDYNTMTSTFLPLDGSSSLGLPTKVSFSSQEWCGNVYDQLLFDPGSLRRTAHSYFDGEADREQSIGVPDGGVAADAMLLLVRGLAGDLLDPGEERTVPWLPRLIDTRLGHTELAWTEATLTRSAGSAPVETAAGTIDAYTVTAAERGGPTTTWRIEVAPPHRIVAWHSDTGEQAVLTGSLRLDYWRRHSEGDESLRSQLGLPVSLQPER